MTATSKPVVPGNGLAWEAAARLKEFRELGARGALCTEASERLADEAAESFLAHYRTSGEYLTDAIALLAEIATLEEPCLAEPGQRATFPLLVERLSDSFEPALCDVYDRVFTQLITHCRSLPAGAQLDATLKNYDLQTETDFLERKARLRRRAPWREAAEQRKVRKALVLSRVTLGADVAVTSVALQRARDLFPEARRVLIGSPKARELFGGDASLEIREVPYRSGGTLIERLESWLDVRRAVEEDVGNSDPQEYAVIDPDSRYLQLGMLPVLRDESRYFFFESRRAGGIGPKTLSQLTSDWLAETFGGEGEVLPRVWLRKQDQEFGLRERRRLVAGGSRWIVAISFGVGGNHEKRFPAPFEDRLLARLIEDGCTLLLDQGAGEEELARAGRLAEVVRGGGGRVVEISADSDRTGDEDNVALPCEMLTWQGGVGAWAGLIAASDEFIGYDSAGQHIAAALGIPTVSIFTANTTQRFRQRWRPTGPGMMRMIVGTDQSMDRLNSEKTSVHAMEEVLGAHVEFRKLRNR